MVSSGLGVISDFLRDRCLGSRLSRDECLNEHLFDTLRHARRMTAAWRSDYDLRPGAVRGGSGYDTNRMCLNIKGNVF